MRSFQLVLLAGLIGVFCLVRQPAEAHGRTFVSFGVNVGGPYYRPWGWGGGWGPYGWYRPYPYYYPPVVIGGPVVVPPPVVAPAPVVVAQPAVPATAPTPSAPVYRAASQEPVSVNNIDQQLGLLSNGDEKIRQQAVMDLGRMKADQAVDPLTATLAGDASPAVREAAARALGLIAAPRSLPALTRAAQLDADRDVRHSAQFAVEIIRSNSR